MSNLRGFSDLAKNEKIPISNPRPGDLDPQKIHSKAISDHNYNYLGLLNLENPITNLNTTGNFPYTILIFY